MALFFDAKPGDTLRIAGTKVTFETKSGNRTRVRIEGSDDVKLQRAGEAEEGAKPARKTEAAPAPPAPASAAAPTAPVAEPAPAPMFRRQPLPA